MKPVLITAPVSNPVTLQEVKEHMRVWFSDDDVYIAALLDAAVSHLDGYKGTLNRCIVSQTWRTSHRHFCREMETLFTDTTAVVLKYYDVDNVLQTVDDANYQVYADYIRLNRSFVIPAVYSDRDDAVLMESTHGYETVPETLKLAIKILVTHWYRNRAPVSFGGAPTKIPHSIDALVAPHRWAF